MSLRRELGVRSYSTTRSERRTPFPSVRVNVVRVLLVFGRIVLNSQFTSVCRIVECRLTIRNVVFRIFSHASIRTAVRLTAVNTSGLHPLNDSAPQHDVRTISLKDGHYNGTHLSTHDEAWCNGRHLFRTTGVGRVVSGAGWGRGGFSRRSGLDGRL